MVSLRDHRAVTLQMHGDVIEPYVHWTHVTSSPSNA